MELSVLYVNMAKQLYWNRSLFCFKRGTMFTDEFNCSWLRTRLCMLCVYPLQGELLLFFVQVGKSVQTQGHPQGVDVLLQRFVLVVQAASRLQQLIQIIL